ncbi:hypothetical protein Tco_1273663 [Tanacetum coccineum]
MSQTPSNTVPINSSEQEVAMRHPVPMRFNLPASQTIPLPNLELALNPTTMHEPFHETQSPSSPFYPDTPIFSDGEPTSESPELNPEDVTARLQDIEVEVDTLHADSEDKELLISELQDSLATAENEITVLQLRVDDAEARQENDHAQIQIILSRLGL